MLSLLAKIYDPLGIAGTLTVIGKNLYREICDTKIAWDAVLPPNLQRKFRAWEESLPPSDHTKIPGVLSRANHSSEFTLLWGRKR